jgi:hypothetical protein
VIAAAQFGDFAAGIEVGGLRERSLRLHSFSRR